MGAVKICRCPAKLKTEYEVPCSVRSFSHIGIPRGLPLPRTANWKPQGVRGVSLKRDTSILSFPAISEDHSDVQLHQPLQELGEKTLLLQRGPADQRPGQHRDVRPGGVGQQPSLCWQSEPDHERQLQSLTDRFTALRSVTEPAKVVRETGAVLKLLQPLADKTAKIESGNCPESLRSLALLVTEISEKPELRLKFSVRENLKKSSATLSIVNVFLSQLEPTIARMKRFCTDDNQYNRDAMVAIGDLMLDLSNMYSSLGDLRTGEEFRYGKLYIDRVAAQLEKLEEVGLGQSDCVSNGDLGGAAEILDQLATLIEEAGIESLKEQLGADLSFDFDFDPATSAIRRFNY